MKKLTSIKLKSLIIAKTVDELQSMSAAAVKFNSHQPYISKIISDLEKGLGFKIFNRDNAGVTTTTMGKNFIEKVDNILMAYGELDNFIAGYKNSACGEVYIYGDDLALNFIASKISPCLTTIQGDVSIRLIATLGEYAPDNNDEWDLIVSSTIPKDDNIIVREIAEIGYNCFASPTLFNTTFHDPSFLSKAACIIWEDNMLPAKDGRQWIFTIDKQQVKIDIAGKISCNNMSTAIEMSKNGLGIIYVPYYTVQEHFDSERLIPLFDYRLNHYKKIYLIYRRRDNQPFIVNQVIDHITDYVQHALPLTC